MKIHQEILGHIAELHYLASGLKSSEETHSHLNRMRDLVQYSQLEHEHGNPPNILDAGLMMTNAEGKLLDADRAFKGRKNRSDWNDRCRKTMESITKYHKQTAPEWNKARDEAASKQGSGPFDFLKPLD
jgi:hypothetical protein